jgi:hypothetical protein
MPTQSDTHEIEVVELTPEEQDDYIRAECQRLLGISVEEFTRRWLAGEYRANDDPKVTQVAMLLPDAR